MKKNILAVVISSVLATTYTQAFVALQDKDKEINVSGRVFIDYGQSTSEKDPKERATAFEKERIKQKVGGDVSARLGMDGKYRIVDDWQLICKLEWDLKAEAGSQEDSLTPRYIHAGFEKNGLQAVFGRAANPFNQIVDYTDIFNVFGVGVSGAQTGLNVASRYDDTLALSYQKDGLDLRVAGALTDQRRSLGLSGLEKFFSASAGYTAEFTSNLKLKAALAMQKQFFVFSTAKDTPVNQKNKGFNEVYGLGIGFDVYDFYLGTTYSHKKAVDAGDKQVADTDSYFSAADDKGINKITGKSNGVDVVATYKLTEKFKLLAGYTYEKGDLVRQTDNATSTTKNDQRFIDAFHLGIDYQVLESCNIYGEGKYDHRSDAVIDGSHIPANRFRWGVGAVYRF